MGFIALSVKQGTKMMPSANRRCCKLKKIIKPIYSTKCETKLIESGDIGNARN